MDKIELKGKKITKVLGTATLATAVLFSTTGVTQAATWTDNPVSDTDSQLEGTPIEDPTDMGPVEPDVYGGINPELDLNNNGILDFEEEDVAPSNPVVTNPTPSSEQPTVEATTETPTVEATTETPTVEATTETPTVEATTETPTVEATTETPTVEATTETPTVEATTETPTVEATTETPTVEATTETPTVEATTEAPTTEVPTTETTPVETSEQPTTESPTTEAPKEELNLDTVKLTKEVPYKDVIKTDKSPTILNQVSLPLVFKVGEGKFDDLKLGMKVETPDGTDLQDTLKIESNIDFNKPGEYVVKYTAGVGEDISELYVLAIVEGEVDAVDPITTPVEDGDNTTPVEDGDNTTPVEDGDNTTPVEDDDNVGTIEPISTVIIKEDETKKGDKIDKAFLDDKGNVVDVDGNIVKYADNNTKPSQITDSNKGKGVGNEVNDVVMVEDNKVDMVNQEDTVKQNVNELPDTGETDKNTGLIAGLLMAVGLGFLVNRKKSLN